MSNTRTWEIPTEVDCHSVNVIHCLKCKMCNQKGTYIAKIIGDTFPTIRQGFQNVSSCVMYRIVLLRIIV